MVSCGGAAWRIWPDCPALCSGWPLKGHLKGWQAIAHVLLSQHAAEQHAYVVAGCIEAQHVLACNAHVMT